MTHEANPAIPTGVLLRQADGKLPEGAVQGRTDFGMSGYGGACPPVGHGPHRYQFTVYALSLDNLPLDEQAAMVGFFVPIRWIRRASRSRHPRRPSRRGATDRDETAPLSRHLQHPLNNQAVSAFI